jgi:hypothetical protein
MSDNVIVGKRLAQLRGELTKVGDEVWSQARVGEAIGITANMVSRLEQFCAGNIDALLGMLRFYQDRGYNISWIVSEDNSGVSKHMLSDANKAVDAQFVLEKIDELKELISSQ